jgi:hypothetical protein
MRIKEIIGEERDFDVLVRSLARKLLREETAELPSSVLAGICGVSEKEWDRIFSRRRNFLSDILSLPVKESGAELEQLDKEERNFVDKLDQILRIIFWTNTTYPEIAVLFHNLVQDPEMDKKIGIQDAMDSLRNLAFDILKRQAYEEGIVEENSQMEKLLFFLIHQMMIGFHGELFQLCESYVECRNPLVFPEEDEFVDRFLDPVKDQLKGFTAV